MSTANGGTGPGSSPTDAAWYEGASGWLPVSRAFIDLELAKPEPDYRSFADRLAAYSAAERHAGWIGVAQSAPTRMARTRAYVEALYNDADPTSVAWSWLDGDFDLMERVEHVISPSDEHTPATVEAVRNRIGSIIDFGGGEMAMEPTSTAGAATDVGEQAAGVASAAEGTPTAEGAAASAAVEVLEVAAAPEAAAGPAEQPDAVPATAQDQAAAAAQDQAAGPAGAHAAQPVADQSPSPAWFPTHFVPTGGMAAWDYPDPSRQPRVVLSAGLGLVVDGSAGEWALVRAVNGWRGWVDGRRLATRP